MVVAEEAKGLNGMGKMFNVEQAAQFLNVKVSTIRRLVFRKKLPCYKIGALVRFSEAGLKSYLEKNMVGVGVS